jgi:hypothetical protein
MERAVPDLPSAPEFPDVPGLPDFDEAPMQCKDASYNPPAPTRVVPPIDEWPQAWHGSGLLAPWRHPWHLGTLATIFVTLPETVADNYLAIHTRTDAPRRPTSGLVRGDTVILAENDRNDSKIAV